MEHCITGSVILDSVSGCLTHIQVDLGEPKVCQFEMAFIGYQHVVWFKVPTHHR